MVLISLLLLQAFTSSVSAEDAISWFTKGNDLTDKGMYDQATDAYLKAIDINPHYLNAWIGLGFVYTKMGRYDDAISAYNRSLIIEPNSTLAWNSLGYVFGQKGKNLQALQAYEKAIAIDPTDPTGWLNKGLVLSSMNKLNESITSYQRVIELDPNNYFAWLSIGLDFMTVNSNDEALEAFNKALEIDPRSSDAWNFKGLTLFKMGRYQEAIEAYNRGLIVDPKNVDLQENRDIAESKLRQYIQGESNVPFTTIAIILITVGIISGLVIVKVRGYSSKKYKLTDLSLQSITTEPTPGEHPQKTLQVDHEVFISYSSKDKPIADAICATLESRSIRCWMAPRDVLPGTNYPRAIIDAIESSKIMVLIFSSHSNSSPHVVRELSHAVSKGVIIIPFRIEDIQPSKDMEYLIGIPHWLDAMTQPLEQHVIKLSQTIQFLLQEPKKGDTGGSKVS